MLRLVKSLVSSILLAGCSVVGVRDDYKQPGYRVVDRIDGDVEIRRYARRTAAETSVPLNSGNETEGRAFSALASYIFGGNLKGEKIAMTAPVEAASSSVPVGLPSQVAVGHGTDMYRMRFFLPGGYDSNTAPAPNDARVRLVDLPEETIAVLRFSGSRADSHVDEFKEHLLATVGRTDWVPSSEPVAFFYDPPWTLPSLRRNEVAVSVERR